MECGEHGSPEWKEGCVSQKSGKAGEAGGLEGTWADAPSGHQDASQKELTLKGVPHLENNQDPWVETDFYSSKTTNIGICIQSHTHTHMHTHSVSLSTEGFIISLLLSALSTTQGIQKGNVLSLVTAMLR